MPLRPARFLVLAALVVSCRSSGAGTDARRDDTTGHGQPTVFARGEGERRMMGGTRPLFIVADSATVGSRTLVAGYEEVPPGDSGRTHMHLEQDEIIFVHRGELDLLLADSTHRARPGTTTFIPRRTWLKFEATGSDTAGFFFVFNVPGFERCLRALSAGPGERFEPPSNEALDRVSRECHYVRKKT
jgi:mannose-6-phosphate isomerase-like protein (cupin superfamily)